MGLIEVYSMKKDPEILEKFKVLEQKINKDFRIKLKRRIDHILKKEKVLRNLIIN